MSAPSAEVDELCDALSQFTLLAEVTGSKYRTPRPSSRNSGLITAAYGAAPGALRAEARATSTGGQPATIFQRHNLSSFGDDEYERLLPALRLASRILTSPLALEFWHALLYGTRRTVKDSHDRAQQSFSRTHKGDLPPSESVKVLGALEELATAVTFEVGNTIVPKAYARCACGDPVGPTTIGRRSTIHINEAVMRALATSSTMGKKRAKRNVHLGIATLLCHELAHAMSNAAYGLDIEMFFENDTACELGYAFEKFVIGGRIDIVDFEQVLLQRLPEFSTYERAVKYNITYPIRKNHPRSSNVAWRVGHKRIRRMFEDRFWSVTVPATAGKALRVPKLKKMRQEKAILVVQ